ncbi:hypothetical protein CPB84DRAFT_1782164 [Gymnopilus junonius]|uniref:BPL/LPL catalytic domain-containing protein n=1 Tax=Gymnopilus junonius TaxID=109634 RepID=A0A9P5NMH2_GYMJU|nr:hypothetical protein CPB84DRAFT_1782164 [Gymnopilus junonius]
MLGTDPSVVQRSRGLGLGSTGLTFELATSETPLKFYDKSNDRYITFEDHDVKSQVPPRIASIKISDDALINGIYDEEVAEFRGFEDIKGASVVAHYQDEGKKSVAGLVIEISKGRMALWGPSIEYPLTEPPVSSVIASSTKLSLEEAKAADQGRKNKTHYITTPSPVLTATPSEPTSSPQSGVQLSTLKDANDEFNKSAREQANAPSDPSTWQPKHIILCRDGALPRNSLSAETWGIGEALMYGEAVTSTQTMLDKNPYMLSHLPTPLLSLASHQLAGRGRGSNVWLSPSGCLQFSLLLRLSLAHFPATKIVFLQYLFALAVVEACRDEKVLGPKAGEKICGKLAGFWSIPVFTPSFYFLALNTLTNKAGCGLNVLNPPPITSLSQLQSASREALSMEQTAALIMAKFESMWRVFMQEKGSFEPFMNLYLGRWLHSDQLVTLTTTTPQRVVRIAGITLDHGLLRTVPERSGMFELRSGGDVEYIDLQPDGNSFDLMLNLIKSKT